MTFIKPVFKISEVPSHNANEGKIKPLLKRIAKDIRGGSEMVQSLILVIAVALFCYGAFKYFAGKITDKAKEAGDKIPAIVTV